MIFEETEDGLSIHINHKAVMEEDIVDFILNILYGREMYQRHYHAELDDDHPDGERYRSRDMDVVILESSHRYQAVY